ncbi:WD40 repeat-like protein, partial [Nadsonia fulvescens var. elongata DSM 6958]
PLFRYKAMFTKPKLFIPHFQIRQLLCPLSKNALFYSLLSYDDFNIQRLDPETGNVFTVIGANQIQPMYNRTCVVSSMDVNDDFLVAGCYDGQYIYRTKLNVGSTGIASGVLSNDTNDMINHTNIISRSHLPPQVIFSSNEGTVIMLDLKTNQIINTYQAPDSMNCTSYCPTNPNIKLLQGDFKTSLIIDTNSSDCQRPLLSLEGQLDFGSACAWSPRHNYIVATGNQDGFCRIYDLRFVKPNSKPLHSLMTDYELPVRSMRFDKGGRFLMFAEPVDNVTILDATTDFKQGQTLNVLGEIAGIGFNDDADDGQCVSIGIADTYIGGIMQFSRGN